MTAAQSSATKVSKSRSIKAGLEQALPTHQGIDELLDSRLR